MEDSSPFSTGYESDMMNYRPELLSICARGYRTDEGLDAGRVLGAQKQLGLHCQVIGVPSTLTQATDIHKPLAGANTGEL